MREKTFMKDEPTSKREIAPGFFETRRRLIQLPIIVAAGAILGRAEKFFSNHGEEQAMTRMTTGDLDWQSFLKECLPVAQELHKDSSYQGQEAYLHWLASMIERVRASEIPRAKLGRFGKLEPAVHFGVEYRGKPFFIVEWWLEPGATLPPHCHPNASVCTLGIEGEARIRNFEVVGKTPAFESRETFLVRETHNEIIAPGRINALSALRDNIHTFQAGCAGARGIDISTYHGPDIGFSFLDIAAKPRDTNARTFEAAWKGMSV
jgi:hypothetical protein